LSKKPNEKKLDKKINEIIANYENQIKNLNETSYRKINNLEIRNKENENKYLKIIPELNLKIHNKNEKK